MEHQVVFFDGVCNLCTGVVRFIIPRDHNDLFRFVSLQSPLARTLLKNYPVNPEQTETILLLKNGKLYQQSDAALHIAAGLGGGWRLLKLLLLIPPFIRNFLYVQIARNRYRIWGKQESCLVPEPSIQAKFL